jgi:hypothetical protein
MVVFADRSFVSTVRHFPLRELRERKTELVQGVKRSSL